MIAGSLPLKQAPIFIGPRTGRDSTNASGILNA